MDIVEIPTFVLLCLFQGLVAGLLGPRPSLQQTEQSSKKRKVPGAPHRQTTGNNRQEEIQQDKVGRNNLFMLHICHKIEAGADNNRPTTPLYFFL